MKKIFIILAITTQFVSLLFAVEYTKTGVAIKIEKEPKIDGLIDNEEWSGAFWEGSFVALPGDTLTRQQSKFAVIFSSSNIYIAVLCDEIHRDKIKPFDKNEVDIWRHDSLEIFIQSKNKTTSYKQFLLSVGGGRYSLELDYVGWLKRTQFPENEWESKVILTDTGYAAEIKIPFSVFDSETPSNGDEWRLNILRNTTTLDSDRYSTWTPLSKVNEPEKFGYLIFAVTDPELIRQRIMVERKLTKIALELQQLKLKYSKIAPEFVVQIDENLDQKGWETISRQSENIMNMKKNELINLQKKIESFTGISAEMEKLRGDYLLDSFF